ncbi:hypothetical protein [Vibrio parahaemolyticus]|uniref:hypothetical protein n=2 Tax=Vibrio parahaemolyticus TaxID=670 RepID=UPI0007DC1718|nr:hypothetical protein [Vibrio parahaemolyticus]EGQ8195750.1 hypothetical protein [Vibrio parahaemolyticus]EHD6031630.1 hypothetical protein [Vibrio parahaemolyticus]EJR0958088.1 hypothetical protein [Vibrio parahaemolyticus]EKA7361406.1 hypothetical protein [Vibrio parahaemolyticus]EKB1992555.1 hypothetical protein [Vibrio parahaemolyticus]
MKFIELLLANWSQIISLLAVIAAFLSSIAAFMSAFSAKKSANLAESQQKLVLVQAISNSLQSICNGVSLAKETKTTIDFAYAELAVFCGQVGGSRQAMVNKQTEQRVKDLLPLEDIALEKLASISSFSSLTISQLIIEQASYEAFNQQVSRSSSLLNQELADVMRSLEMHRAKAI